MSCWNLPYIPVFLRVESPRDCLKILKLFVKLKESKIFMLRTRYPVLLLQRLIAKSLKNAFVVQYLLKMAYLSFKFFCAFKIWKGGGIINYPPN